LSEALTENIPFQKNPDPCHQFISVVCVVLLSLSSLRVEPRSNSIDFGLIVDAETTSDDLIVPAVRLTSIGSRTFPAARARIWNTLPLHATA